MLNEKTFLILSQVGPINGFGHLIRCNVIIQYLIKQTYSFRALLKSDYSEESIIIDSFWQINNWKNKSNLKEHLSENTIVLIDSYDSDEELYKFIFDIVDKVFFFDDLNYHVYPFGIRLQPRLLNDYSPIEQNRVISGPGIIPIRSDFFHLVKVTKDIEMISNYRFLLMLGSNLNIENYKKIILQILKCYSNVQFTIISNFELSDHDFVDFLSSYNVSIFRSIDGGTIAELFSNTDLLICSGGQVLLEAIAAKMTFIPVLTAQNQIQAFEDMLELGITRRIINIQNSEFIFEILEEVNAFFSGNSLCKGFFTERIIIDEFGAERLIETMRNHNGTSS
jgi:spore coat polysaccharide biosynthesis predicted glycosyltransferase SpsG